MIELKELANKYAESHYSRTGPQAKSDAYSGARNGFIAGVNFAHRWARFSDELPPSGVEILAKNNARIQVVIYDKRDITHHSIDNRNFLIDGICYEYWRHIEYKP
jgi:hypothetical protein